MSSRNETETVVAHRGVRVEKRRPANRPDVAVVELRITGPERPRLVRVVDEIPEGVQSADVGFDPERRDDWRHENDRVWFTTVVGDDPVETTYGIRGLATDDVAGRPRIDVVMPVDEAPAAPRLGD